MLSFGNIFTSDESVVRQNNKKKDLQELVLMVIVKKYSQ